VRFGENATEERKSLYSLPLFLYHSNVTEREREREILYDTQTERNIDRQTERDRGRERERGR
jgi:hypothetical protein